MAVKELTTRQIAERKAAQEAACNSEQDFYLLGVDRRYDNPKGWAWHKWQDRLNGVSKNNQPAPKKSHSVKKKKHKHSPKEISFTPKVDSSDNHQFAPIPKPGPKTLSPIVRDRVTVGADRYDIAF